MAFINPRLLSVKVFEEARKWWGKKDCHIRMFHYKILKSDSKIYKSDCLKFINEKEQTFLYFQFAVKILYCINLYASCMCSLVPVLLLDGTFASKHPWTSNTVKLINITKYYRKDNKVWILIFASSLPIVWPCTTLIRFLFQRSEVNMVYLSLKINTTILTGTFCILIFFVFPQIISFFASFV